MIAVIADTHLPRGARKLSQECLDVLAAADLILHAGDVASAAALEELRSLAPVQAVHGNVDEPALQRRLPARLGADLSRVANGVLHDARPAAGRAERLHRAV